MKIEVSSARFGAPVALLSFCVVGFKDFWRIRDAGSFWW